MSRLRGLYVVTDPAAGADLTERVRQAIEGGARLVQYRDKGGGAERRRREAQGLLALCRAGGVPLVINDDLELALGSSSASPATTNWSGHAGRKRWGPTMPPSGVSFPPRPSSATKRDGALPPCDQQLFFDLRNRLGGVQFLRAGLGAIHDGVAAIEPERVFQIVIFSPWVDQ